MFFRVYSNEIYRLMTLFLLNKQFNHKDLKSGLVDDYNHFIDGFRVSIEKSMLNYVNI